MTFHVASDAYDRLIGRYSVKLAPLFADFAAIGADTRVVDVGAGPGALTAELAARAGAGRVAAIDPSEPFVAACRARVPGADVRCAGVEELPWEDASFDAAVAQLVVNFLRDAERGVREMARVVRPGGVVAACTLDLGEGVELLHVFTEAARSLDPNALDHGPVNRYRKPDELRELWLSAGLSEVETAPLVVEVEYRSFDDFWAGFLTGIGPDSAYCVSLDSHRQELLRDECRRRLGSPAGSFTLKALAWAVRGHVA